MNYFKESFSLLLRRKSNSILAISAISSAVFLLLITASVSLYFMELSKSISKNFENRVFLCEKKSFWIGGGLISEEKLSVIESITGVKTAIPMLVSRLNADEIVIMGVPFVVIGIPPEHIHYYISDINTAAVNGNSVILGWDIAKSRNLQKGDKIDIRGTDFFISDIRPKTSSITDRQAIVSLKELQKILSREHLLTSIIVIPNQGYDLKLIATQISEKITWLQALTPDELETGIKESSSFWNSLTFVFMLIAGVGSIFSLYTITAMTVTEQKKDIAMKKAIGAENKHIFKEFLALSFWLTVAGWFLGLFLACLFIVLSFHMPLTKEANVFKLNLQLIIISFIWSCGISLISCLIPLKKITSMNVAQVLRS